MELGISLSVFRYFILFAEVLKYYRNERET